MSSKPTHESIQLKTLAAVAFDRAARLTSDPERAAQLATFTMTRWLRRAGQLHLLQAVDTNGEPRAHHGHQGVSAALAA